MKSIRIILLSLCLSFGLVGCIQSDTHSLEFVRSPTQAQPKNQASLTPTETQTVFPTPTTTLTLTPSPTLFPSIPSPTKCQSDRGHVEVKQLDTNWLPNQLQYRVYTPPCYEHNINQHYPVLYLIHGYNYDDDQWDRLGADEILNQLIVLGEVPPFIIILPYDREHNIQPPENKFGEALVHDLLQTVDADYRTTPSRQYRAIGGLSRGGNWAIRIGLINWPFFGSIGSHSGPLFVSDGPAKISHWLDQIPPDAHPQIYLDIGERDKWLKRIVSFEGILVDYNIPHELHIFPGGHTEDYWSSHIEQYIRWYARDW